MPEKTPNPIGQPERSTSRDASQENRMADGKTSAVADDSALLQRIRQGDQAAMAELFDRHGRAVFSVAVHILKDDGHAEDVMQEIFFQIWQNSDSFAQTLGSLGTWLVVIARNRSIDLLRRRKPTTPLRTSFWLRPATWPRSRTQRHDREGAESLQDCRKRSRSLWRWHSLRG